MHKCTDCKASPDEKPFSKKKNGYQSRCKECYNIYFKGYYGAHKSQCLAKTNRNRTLHRERLRQIVLEHKVNPCYDCQLRWHPKVMDFDHRPDVIKIDNISDLVKAAVPIQVLLDEIKKCDLLCANCHRLRTFGIVMRPVM